MYVFERVLLLESCYPDRFRIVPCYLKILLKLSPNFEEIWREYIKFHVYAFHSSIFQNSRRILEFGSSPISRVRAHSELILDFPKNHLEFLKISDRISNGCFAREIRTPFPDFSENVASSFHEFAFLSLILPAIDSFGKKRRGNAPKLFKHDRRNREGWINFANLGQSRGK